jgi:hypothetical protein
VYNNIAKIYFGKRKSEGGLNGAQEQQGRDLLLELQKREIRREDARPLLFQQDEETRDVLRKPAGRLHDHRKQKNRLAALKAETKEVIQAVRRLRTTQN